MITYSINIIETSEATGIRNNVLSHEVLSVDSFNVEGGTVSRRTAMSGSSVVKISDLVDLASISSITIMSKSDTDDIYPLFDTSVLDSNGDPVTTLRGCLFAIAGVQGVVEDIQIDNMEDRGDNPEINIYITSKP